MNDVMQAVGVFFSYAVLAVFAQNAVFTLSLIHISEPTRP